MERQRSALHALHAGGGTERTVLRVDPADPDNRQVVAYGFRNPFRIATRPGTNEPWIGDVGNGSWEEIDRVPDMTVGGMLNFGWPCYEGSVPEGGFQPLNTSLCTALYSAPTAMTQAYYQYRHGVAVVPAENCNASSDQSPNSSITALGFYNGTTYPAAYKGALFFADHSRLHLGDEARPGRAARSVADRTGARSGRDAGGPPGRAGRQPLQRGHLDRAGQPAGLRRRTGGHLANGRRAGDATAGCYTCRATAS